MSKQIPYVFDSIISSPLQQVSEKIPNTGRARVRAFSKYGNRNGSYITDQVADQLIESTIIKHIPVVGFFDPQTQTWASHTGPTLASAYGYVEDFLGWEPVEDTDGVVRDYAVFSIVLHTDYFEEANKIIGENHSMELNPRTIEGDWVDFGDAEYYVYTYAEMLGFCVIGSHEPCFSASTFFSKNEENKTQFEQFFSLLFELKSKVDEAKNNEGGERPMDENITPVVEQEETPEVFENQETTGEAQETVVETPAEFEETPEVVVENEPDEISELRANYATIQAQLEEANQQIADFNTKLEAANQLNSELQEKLTTAENTISMYEKKEAEIENSKKENLMEKYEKVLSAEEITPIKDTIADFSYSELESKLALIHSRKNLTESKKIPIPEIQESEFAKIIKNYRK